ncbi:hypothetical protein SAMN05443543_10815 [Flavobacterium flevense]|uniref:Uncharacterized protein n=1 Tax=Flavobacterium flevense TaxID=983 RepID=A0A4Y4AZJ4_9FLAO|nr:hypothetical protein [Flavobacterium flevense]GEC73618.1 hypothetical protein FFL01_31570 [Flavobacterium flevense]SHL97209.1 hypothetical protein SAMN05443543_10815 [Flavobacterium flevense]
MTRQEKRQFNRENQKKTTNLKTYKPITKSDRIIIISISLVIIFSFLYVALRDNSLPNNELASINVILKSSPKYDEYKIKSTTYRDIILSTKEYNREFKITDMTYKATDHEAFKSNIKSGDSIELKVLKSEVSELNEKSFWNDYNDVYGLTKNGRNFIDIELRTELKDSDSKWSYFFITMGLIMLPYGFMKRKPLISMDKAITTICVLGLILILIVNRA